MLGKQDSLTLIELLEQEENIHGQEMRIGNCWNPSEKRLQEEDVGPMHSSKPLQQH